MSVILLILDGLNADTAEKCMGYLQAACQSYQGKYQRISCALPSLSRPLYECILTGVEPVHSGVVHNGVCRLSHHKSIFHHATENGLTTAAAAYHWVSELYNHAPYDAVRDRHTADLSLPIQYGHFYSVDDYPDSHVFIDAESLRLRHQPDFLLIHSMNIDDAGHQHGAESGAYRNAARHADGLLSQYLPQWLAENYCVVITADHGMNADHSHGGALPEEREVPFYCFGIHPQDKLPSEQRDICPSIAQWLGLPEMSFNHVNNGESI